MITPYKGREVPARRFGEDSLESPHRRLVDHGGERHHAGPGRGPRRHVQLADVEFRVSQAQRQRGANNWPP